MAQQQVSSATARISTLPAEAVPPRTTAQGAFRASIVVPTYCEADNLEELVIRITHALIGCDIPFEILIVDDNSQDGTREVVHQLRESGYDVRLLVRRGKRGLSSAVLEGFAQATGDILVCMDADLSHPPEALGPLIASVTDRDVDFAIGSRYVPGGATDPCWSWFRRWNSRGATWLARPFSSARDPLSGFFALRRDVFQRAGSLDPIGYKVGLEILVKCQCRRVVEIPIHFQDRQRGHSKLTLGEQLRYLRHLKRLADYRWGTPWQFVQFVMVGLSGVAVDLAVYRWLWGQGLALTLARALAIWLAMTWNFLWNRRITFGRQRQGNIAGQYLRYVLGSLAGATINWSIAVLAPRYIDFLDGRYLWAACLGIVAGTVFNYLAARIWAFPVRSMYLG